MKAQAWQTESFTFVLPESADAACVWVVLNPDADPEQPVQLLTRSLAQQLARMSDLSVATPDKLQKLMKSVLAKNKVALALISDSTICPDTLQGNLDVTHGHVTVEDLAVLRERAKTSKSAALLSDSASEEERLAWHEHQRFRKAVEQLRPTSKEAIFREYFPDTPDGSYDDIWDRMEMRAQNAERLMRRRTLSVFKKMYRTLH